MVVNGIVVLIAASGSHVVSVSAMVLVGFVVLVASAVLVSVLVRSWSSSRLWS